jgi:hypothetical protein
VRVFVEGKEASALGSANVYVKGLGSK